MLYRQEQAGTVAATDAIFYKFKLYSERYEV